MLSVVAAVSTPSRPITISIHRVRPARKRPAIGSVTAADRRQLRAAPRAAGPPAPAGAAPARTHLASACAHLLRCATPRLVAWSSFSRRPMAGRSTWARCDSCVQCAHAWLIALRGAGQDKHENEELIKYSFPTDVWFHVDDLSSAHVYLRMPFVRWRRGAGPPARPLTCTAAAAQDPGRHPRRRPRAVQADCQGAWARDAAPHRAALLMRAPGGRKTPSRARSGRQSTSCAAAVAAPLPAARLTRPQCYTLAPNLKKTQDMAVGQVGFRRPREVRPQRAVASARSLTRGERGTARSGATRPV